MSEIKRRRIRYIAAFSGIIVILVILCALNLGIGSVNIKPMEIFRILLGTGSRRDAANIILNIRLPRMLAALVLGGALSVSGFALQTFFSNPIAGPFVLGISSGAKLAVAAVMIFFLGRGMTIGSPVMICAAFAGSMISMAFVLAVSGKTRSMGVLVICGVMIGYICSALTEFLVTFADDSNIVNLHNWSMGSFSGISMQQVGIMSVVVAYAMAFSGLLAKPMGAFMIGEAYAKSVGVNIKLFKLALIMLSGVLAACVTAFAGPVSFVGVAVPHIAKKLFNTSMPQVILPGSFLLGGAFCLLCDFVARMAFSPTEMSISTVTAVFGAPVVIRIMLGRRRLNER